MLTETFEKAYLQANMKTIFYLIVCLYAITALFNMTETSAESLRNDTKWIMKLFTSVCTVDKLQSREVCDIPFSRMTFTTEQIIRINDMNTLNDVHQLYYAKCSYRHESTPWGWCDISSKGNHTIAHRILVIGNSYAANQGRIVHESCASSDVEVKIFVLPGCEVLIVSKMLPGYRHCYNSRSIFQQAVLRYRPDVLFILTRHVDLMEFSTTTSNQTTKTMVDNAVAVLRDLSQVVTNEIFVLNAIPRQTTTFEADHTAALRAGKVLDQTSFINHTLNLPRTRATVERAVALCTKCTVIDYTDVFTVNGTFQSFDDQTHLAYFNGQLHLTPFALNRLRPFFKQICDKISYSERVLL